jgi:hypothetical protein
VIQKVSAPAVESDRVTVGMVLVPMETASAFLEESDEVMMAMSFAPPSPPSGGGGGGGGSGGSSNLLVELSIHLPEGFRNSGHIEVFTKDDLIYSPMWGLGDSWVPTYGSQTVYWTDPASSNKMERFYYISDGTDSDGDGHSDLREVWVDGTDSNSFTLVNSDNDDLHDWWETKLFGDLSQTGSVDTDGDGLLNNEELISGSVGQPATLISDPNVYDSDAEGLNDFQEVRVWGTDPLNPDSDFDGLTDAAEALGSPATDPNNPDTISPSVAFI